MHSISWTLLLAVAASCSGDASMPITGCTVSAVAVTAAPTRAKPGDGVALTAAVTDSGTCGGGVTWSATPAGATLTPSGTHATFSAAAAQVYTVTATSADDPARSGTATITVADACGTPNGVTVEHKVLVSADETWAGDGVTHIVTTTIHVQAPATVTVAPCAIVKLAPGAEIIIDGDATGQRAARFRAAGTDDTTGFITLGPQTAGQPWGWLHGTNGLSFIELRHTTLTLAGAGGNFSAHAAVEVNGGNAAPTPVLTADHLTIDHPVGGGLFMAGNAAFTADSTQLTVTGATDHPIELGMMTVDTIPPFTGTANAVDDALIIGSSTNVTADLTVRDRLPLRFGAGATVAVAPALASADPVTLTVEPGVTMRFSGGASFTVGFAGAAMRAGRILAVGDADHPIRFTSGAAAPAPGDWAGVRLYNAPGSQLAYVTIEYAGGFSGLVSANCRPSGAADTAGLIVGGDGYVPAADLLTHSTIRDSAGFGIDAVWTGASAGSPDLAAAANGNQFTANAGCDQTLNGVSQGGCPAGGGCVGD